MTVGIVRFLVGKVDFAVRTQEDPAQKLAIINRLHDCSPYELREKDGTLRFSCQLPEAELAEKILREENVEFSMRRYGAANLLGQLFAKTGLLIGIVLAVFMHAWCAGHVWEIRVRGNQAVPTEEIVATLEHLGFYRGCRLQGMDIDRLCLSYLLSEERVEWVHINVWGVTADVEISERKAPPKLLPDKKELCNIVAKCDGIVLETDVYSGGKEVFVGDSVVKGQLLISSFFETRMSGYLLRRARGRVLAQTEPIFEMRIPKVYHTVCPRESREKTSLTFWRHELPILGQGGKRLSLCRRVEHEREVAVFSRLKLPFSLKTESFTPLDTVECRRDAQQARAIYDERLAAWKEAYAENAEFLYEETSESEDEEAYVFITRFLCREDISREKVLGMNGWEFDKST